ncbi:cadmium resistance transporter [Sphaerisporangium sp. NPDC005289]|uniref:cadmium resistance transporter n=1 Tax=Sphaerisporangium sp. NPDC005289 TaxID=3155247 RepID=UPI0033ABAF67
MDGLVATLGTACAVFAGTNVDDIIILTVLFLSARAGREPRARQIVAGQYAGIAVLVAVSAIAALGLTIIPDRWVGLLGLVPLAFGIRGLISALRARHRDRNGGRGAGREGGQEGGAPVAVAGGAFSVAGVTIANGADNLSVYTPMFRTIGLTASLVTIAAFAVLIAVWCAAGYWLGSHKKIIAFVERFGHWLVPLVFVAIGAVIVLESGVAGRLVELL